MSWTFPEQNETNLAENLKLEGIGIVSTTELANLSNEKFVKIISQALVVIDQHRNDPFDAMPVLELEHPRNAIGMCNRHAYANGMRNLYEKINIFFRSIDYHDFTFNDLLCPGDNPKRTLRHLSAFINFIALRREQLQHLKPLLDADGRNAKLTSRISEHDKVIQDHEIEVKMEDAVVQQLDAEVRELEKQIQTYKEKEMLNKTHEKKLKDQFDAANNEKSQADRQLMKKKESISKLSSLIVLQIVLQAHEELRKNLENMQALQDDMNKNEALEKNIKELKAKLSDENSSIRTLEAKLVDKQGKVQQDAEMLNKRIEKSKQEARLKDEKIHKLEENCHNLENKLKGSNKSLQEKMEIQKTEFQATLEKQNCQFSEKLKEKDEICSTLHQNVKDLQTKLRQHQGQSRENVHLQQKVRDLEKMLKELRVKPTQMNYFATPKENETDQSIILGNSNYNKPPVAATVPMKDSVLLSGVESLHEIKRKRISRDSVPGDNENSVPVVEVKKKSLLIEPNNNNKTRRKDPTRLTRSTAGASSTHKALPNGKAAGKEQPTGSKM